MVREKAGQVGWNGVGSLSGVWLGLDGEGVFQSWMLGMSIVSVGSCVMVWCSKLMWTWMWMLSSGMLIEWDWKWKGEMELLRSEGIRTSIEALTCSPYW